MRRLGLIVGVVVATVDGVYLWYVVFVQSATSDLPWRVPFVAAYLGVVPICAVLFDMASSGTSRFSIGLPLVVMGLLVVVALVSAISSTSRRSVAAGASIAGALAAVLVLLAGFEITGRIIACPPGAISGSGGGGFLSESYSYTCQNGRANVKYGP
jgi:hypothetical protein